MPDVFIAVQLLLIFLRFPTCLFKANLKSMRNKTALDPTTYRMYMCVCVCIVWSKIQLAKREVCKQFSVN
jgi:hypothetical protein